MGVFFQPATWNKSMNRTLFGGRQDFVGLRSLIISVHELVDSILFSLGVSGGRESMSGTNGHNSGPLKEALSVLQGLGLGGIQSMLRLFRCVVAAAATVGSRTCSVATYMHAIHCLVTHPSDAGQSTYLH
jgi:hypothetical protein